jgi:hypothetical protein
VQPGRAWCGGRQPAARSRVHGRRGYGGSRRLARRRWPVAAACGEEVARGGGRSGAEGDLGLGRPRPGV